MRVLLNQAGKGFQLHEYQEMIEDTLYDALYSNSSYRGRMTALRRYAEIVLRKLLDIPVESKFMLGQLYNKPDYKELILKKYGPQGPFVYNYFVNITKDIGLLGNKSTHSQGSRTLNQEDFLEILNYIECLQAGLFVAYFSNKSLDEFSPSILSAFSLLPPRVRKLVLESLWEFQKNSVVADKLIKAIFKSDGLESAMQWAFKNQRQLILIGGKTGMNQLTNILADIEKIRDVSSFDYSSLQTKVENWSILVGLDLISLMQKGVEVRTIWGVDGFEIWYQYLQSALHNEATEIEEHFGKMFLDGLVDSVKVLNTFYHGANFAYSTFEEANYFYQKHLTSNYFGSLKFEELLRFTYLGRLGDIK